jgi:hypothetical protein
MDVQEISDTYFDRASLAFHRTIFAIDIAITKISLLKLGVTPFSIGPTHHKQVASQAIPPTVRTIGDGERTTAFDFAFNYERARDPATAFANRELYFGSWREYEVLDSFTIRFRFEPHVVALKARVDDGRLGRIYRVSMVYGNGTAANPYHVFFLRLDRTSELDFVWTDEAGRSARSGQVRRQAPQPAHASVATNTLTPRPPRRPGIRAG